MVVVDQAPACPRCAAGKGCGAGLLWRTGGAQCIEAVCGEGDAIAVGDRVELQLGSHRVLQAALIAYGLPLSGALVAASLAYWFAPGDLESALAAILGMAIGMLIARRRLQRRNCLHEMLPGIRRSPATQPNVR